MPACRHCGLTVINRKKMETTMIIYKYVHPARIDILENTTIRFTQPSDLNDPFETNVSDFEYRQDLIRQQTEENRRMFAGVGGDKDVADAIIADHFNNVLPERFKETIDKTTAILSLTEAPENLLMWSHYADQHRGFVIGFDTDNEFFQDESIYLTPLRRMTYSDVRYQLPVGSSPATDLNVATEWRNALLFRKSLAWKYEEELRLVSSPYNANMTKPAPEGSRLPLCLFNFPPDCIKRVILGANISNLNREIISKVVRVKYPSAEFLQAVLDNHRFDLNLISVT
jgi:hypothetical protein